MYDKVFGDSCLFKCEKYCFWIIVFRACFFFYLVSFGSLLVM